MKKIQAEKARVEAEKNKPSNNQVKREAKAGDSAYVSSKQKKQAKKQAEIKSQQEHATQRELYSPADKAARKELGNAKYCTSQSIMTKKARKIFNNVNRQLDGSISVTVNETKSPVLQRMGDWYRSLEARLGQEAPTPKPVAAPTAPTPAAPAPKPVATTAETMVRETEKAAEKAAKKGGKTAWIAAGALALGALIGHLVTADKKDEQAEEFNQAA